MCTSSWGELLAARLVMGLAIGAKSSTTPAYAAEIAPAGIRGALGTQWQMWTGNLHTDYLICRTSTDYLQLSGSCLASSTLSRSKVFTPQIGANMLLGESCSAQLHSRKTCDTLSSHPY